VYTCVKLLHSVVIWIPILWSNFIHFIALYSYNRNVTLKMAGLSAEKCRWNYHNKIHQRNWVHFVGSWCTLYKLMHGIWTILKKKLFHFKIHVTMLLWCNTALLFSLQVADNRNNQQLGDVLWKFLPSLFYKAYMI
jgi:hypothetical protein